MFGLATATVAGSGGLTVARLTGYETLGTGYLRPTATMDRARVGGLPMSWVVVAGVRREPKAPNPDWVREIESLRDSGSFSVRRRSVLPRQRWAKAAATFSGCWVRVRLGVWVRS